MIVRDKTSWIRMVFALQGTSLNRIWLRVAVITAFAIAMTYVSVYLDAHTYSLTTTPFVLIGLALSIFLGFRNNAAYERYWEGRKLWGSLVNASRTFAIQVLTLINANSEEDGEDAHRLRNDLILLTVAWVHALRHRLRDSDPWEEISRCVPNIELSDVRAQDNVPVGIMQQIAERVRDGWQRGWLAEWHLPLLYGSLAEMTSVQGGCERIKTTPIPFTYSVLTHRTVTLYCFALPCGLHDTVGILTPVVVGLIAYAFFGLDAVGDEIEQPFGLADNHLPLHAISRTIEINLRQLAGADLGDVPSPLLPEDNVLQ